MFVNQLAIETGMAFAIVADPEWRVISDAIDGMDGVEHTMVSLGNGGTHSMTIGGGPALCVVHATADGKTFYTLVDPSQSGSHVDLVLCQQPAQYPSEWTVPKEVALKAAEFFAETGELVPDVNWQQNDTQETADE